MIVNFGLDGGARKISLETHGEKKIIVSLMRGQLILKLTIDPNFE